VRSDAMLTGKRVVQVRSGYFLNNKTMLFSYFRVKLTFLASEHADGKASSHVWQEY
jgi:hypothetical protein